jgi:hypothetical protein
MNQANEYKVITVSNISGELRDAQKASIRKTISTSIRVFAERELTTKYVRTENIRILYRCKI